METTANPARRTPRLLVFLCYVGFISLGLPDGILGVAWPSIRRSFGLPLDALGAMFVVGTSGYLLSSLSAGKILRHMSVGLLLALSSLLTVASMVGYGLSPRWAVMVTLSFFSGFAGGAIDSGFNTFVATNLTNRHVNWLHAFWGVGASTGPMIATLVLNTGASWRWSYLVVAAIQSILVASFFLTLRQWDAAGHTPSPPTPSAPKPGGLFRRSAAWLSMGVFFAYCGVEATTGQWMYSVMVEGRGFAPLVAGTWISLYWTSLTAGRFLIGAMANRIDTTRLLRLAMAGALGGIGLLLTRLPALTLAGLALTGFSLAPIFPSMISITPRRFNAAHVPSMIGYQIGAATLGLAILPGLAGMLAKRAGLESVCVFLFALGLVMIALHEQVAGIRRTGAPETG